MIILIFKIFLRGEKYINNNIYIVQTKCKIKMPYVLWHSAHVVVVFSTKPQKI